MSSQQNQLYRDVADTISLTVGAKRRETPFAMTAVRYRPKFPGEAEIQSTTSFRRQKKRYKNVSKIVSE